MHLLWRLQNGEGPAVLNHDGMLANPEVVGVMIGTNDAGHLASWRDEKRHIQASAAAASPGVAQSMDPRARSIMYGSVPLPRL